MCSSGFLVPLLIAILSWESISLVHGQSSSDFINIDCGKPKDYTYTDSITGLQYVSDFEFVDTGKIYNISTEFLEPSAIIPQLSDLRSFPKGDRNCYTIRPVTQGKKYLLRAFFMYGNYDGINRLPQFDIYLGVNYLAYVSIDNSSDIFYSELLTIAVSDSISFCLVNTGSGSPFVSTLELRPLSDAIYDNVNSSQSLTLIDRIDFGLTSTTLLRYPNDVYDRLWFIYTDPAWQQLSTTSKVSTTSSESFQPPSDVMKTAALPKTGPIFNFSDVWTMGRAALSPGIHIIMHFAELELLGKNESRFFDIFINNETWFENVSLTYLETNTIYSTAPEMYGRLDVSLSKRNGSTRPPIINGFEIYMVMDISESETNSEDVAAMTNIKAIYKLQRDWEGDPCAPVNFTWDGLICSFTISDNPRIIYLNLSSSGLTGNISKSFADLTELRYLDLSRNNFTGTIPESLASLPHLTFLNLAGNKLNGSIPKALLDRSASGSLTLRTDDNPDLCNNTDSCGEKEKRKAVVVVVASVGFILVLLFVVLIVIWRCKRRRHQGSP